MEEEEGVAEAEEEEEEDDHRSGSEHPVSICQMEGMLYYNGLQNCVN